MANREFDGVNINVEFKETANRQQISSGDNVNTLFGKIKKWLLDLKPVAFSGSYNDLLDKPTLPTKTSQLENDVPFLSSNKNAQVFLGVSGLNAASMKLEDIYSTMPVPSVLYYSSSGSEDPIFTNNETLVDILKDHGGFGWMICINKLDKARGFIECTLGFSGGIKPKRAIIGISMTGQINADNVVYIDGAPSYPLTTSLAVTEEGVSALDGTVGKVLNDKFGGCTFEQEGEDFYIVGADAVRKKLGSLGVNKYVTKVFIETWNIGSNYLNFRCRIYYNDGTGQVLYDGGLKTHQSLTYNTQTIEQ